MSAKDGVSRWFCRSCGSPLAAQFDYLPGHIYVPIGILDQADRLQPDVQGFTGARLPWIKLDTHNPIFPRTARDFVMAAARRVQNDPN